MPEIPERTDMKVNAMRELTPKEILEREIEMLEMKLRDFRALYRALPDEMNHDAARALRHLIQSINNHS